MKYATLVSFLTSIQAKNPHHPEYLQATTEIMETLWPFLEPIFLCYPVGTVAAKVV